MQRGMTVTAAVNRLGSGMCAAVGLRRNSIGIQRGATGAPQQRDCHRERSLGAVGAAGGTSCLSTAFANLICSP